MEVIHIKNIWKWIKQHPFITLIIVAFVLIGSENIAINWNSSNLPDPTVASENSNVAETNPTAAPEQSIEANIRSAVNEKIIKSVDVTKQNNGGYGVLVTLNENDFVSAGMAKASINLDMAEIYTALYKQQQNINEADIVVNVNGQTVGKSYMTKDDAKNVDWSQNPAYIHQHVLPMVWHSNINLSK